MENGRIDSRYYFANIFLHNRDYHRIHAPTSGKIVSVERIPGELRFLRPWAYSKYKSLPAQTNERVNVVIEDEKQQRWYLSIVGGPGVAPIELDPAVVVGSHLKVGVHLGHFKIGSTCCLAAPKISLRMPGDRVRVGSRFKSFE
jgi:phosphatidylserine decarboxylase